MIMMPPQRHLSVYCVVVFLKILVHAKQEAARPIPTQAGILVDFMVDYADKNLSKVASSCNKGKSYEGRYYWLGSRYYNKSKEAIQCSFPTPPSFPFVYSNGVKLTEIIYQCDQNQTCCDASCCSGKVPLPPTASGSKPSQAAAAGKSINAQKPTNVAQPSPAVTPGKPQASSSAKSGTTKSDSGIGGFSMPSFIGMAVGILLLIAAIISCVCCCICRRRRAAKLAGRRGPPPRRGPTVRPGYGTMAKLALKTRMAR